MSFPLRTRTRGRPGRNAGTKLVAAAPSFSNPLTGWTTAPVHGVWASDPLWTPPADGGAVASWRNGGSVGGDLVQATGSKQPTYDAALAAYNNAAVVTFATDDVLAFDNADIAQPYFAVIVGDNSTSADGRFVGIGGSTSNGLGSVGVSAWMLRAGSPAVGGGTPDGLPHLSVGEFDGTNRLFVDGALVWSVGGTQALAALSLGAGNAGIGTYGSYLTGSIALVLIFNTDPTALPEWATFKAWVTSTYGITVA